MLRRAGTAAPLALVLLIVVHGSLLRSEVLVERYGTLDRPVWARVLTHQLTPLVKDLHPSQYRWYHVDQPYVGGDPINYLKYAREMRSFYQAHVREPVFLALTRAFLWLLSNQDVAVSFASATGSILTILAAYLLGTAMLSRSAGLALAFLVAIEYDLISWSVDGWRDDVFMATVVFSAWAFVRCQREPTIMHGAAAGVAAGIACLTRITALSFVAPALAWLAVDGRSATRRQRAHAAAAALIVCAAIVAPYLISCAVATGDPLYAINYHTQYYRHGEGLPSEKPMSALSYVASKIGGRPIAALDTAVTGLFVQPFTTKWNGLDGWLPGIATVLSWFSIVGLLTWPFFPEGRMMLVVLLGSLAPYALTWNVAGGGEWRFTMHAYPIYLLASMSGVAFFTRAATILRLRPWRERPINRRTVVAVTVGAALLATLWAGYATLPWFVVREAIAGGNDVSLLTGNRDTPFFGSGWSSPYSDGLTFRVSTGERSVIHIPLPAQRVYQVILRLDPVSPDRQHRAVVLLNRQMIATLILTWNPERVGSYHLLLPAEKVRVGSNELTIVPDTLVSAGSSGSRYASRNPDERLGVRLWHVRVLAPPSSEGGANP
jgi:Dolichyl-phosphate-mannose-protein mannosyltransferase